MVLRLRLSPGLARWRTVLLGLVLLGVVSNRTFLAWTSSGLETALFGFLLLLWVFIAVFGSGSRGSLAWLSLTAGLLALARPDGLLFAAATAAILLVRAASAGRRLGARARSRAAAADPGRARALAARPLRLLASEYVLREAGRRLARGGRALLRGVPARVRLLDLAGAGAGRGLPRCCAAARSPRACAPGIPRSRTRLLVGAALALHFAYYTLRVGGDHFEFRVYQHWVPLLLVSLRGGRRAGRPHAAPHAWPRWRRCC